MEHDQSSYFCRGPDDFCWGPAPVGPTVVTGPQKASLDVATLWQHFPPLNVYYDLDLRRGVVVGLTSLVSINEVNLR